MKEVLPSVRHLLSDLKRPQLQRVAICTGANLAGTKSNLLDSIDEAVRNVPSAGAKGQSADNGMPELRVLSIDMGIRNLAFAFLKQSLSQTGSSKGFTKPVLCQWQRIELKNTALLFTSPASSRDMTGTASTEPADEESFEPPVMARYAYDFAKYCTGLSPTHIVIERQRFRSAGHSAVQEWSLRVGMFEAMLYATFRTLSDEQLAATVSVEPMLPMRANKYWFKDIDVPATGKQAKATKIAIVGDMLAKLGSKDAAFSIRPDVASMIEHFGAKNRAKLLRKTTRLSFKLDDVSDSLLQGLAWLHWQENRRRLAAGELDEMLLNGR